MPGYCTCVTVQPQSTDCSAKLAETPGHPNKISNLHHRSAELTLGPASRASTPKVCHLVILNICPPVMSSRRGEKLRCRNAHTSPTSAPPRPEGRGGDAKRGAANAMTAVDRHQYSKMSASSPLRYRATRDVADSRGCVAPDSTAENDNDT